MGGSAAKARADAEDERAHGEPAEAPRVAILLAQCAGSTCTDMSAAYWEEGTSGWAPPFRSLIVVRATHKMSGERTLSASRRKFSLFHA